MDFASWLRPAMLWGGLALAIPVLIHLLGRKQRRTVPFATLRFLERANARAAARWRLKRFLLLLARMALVALLVALFAGPGCQRGAASAGIQRVLVVDTSYSMLARRDGASSLERGLSALRGLLEGAVEGDRFAVVTTASADKSTLESFLDASTARERIDALAASPEDAGVTAALERAQGILGAKGGGEIVLVTDMQRYAWRGLSATGRMDAPVRVIDAGVSSAANAWIDRVEQSDGEIRIFSARSGAEVKPPAVHLILEDGRKLSSFVENGQATFRPDGAKGLQVVKARVEPGGDLAEDDELPFVASATGPVRVLLVNGDPRGFEILDELLFVRRAFAAGGQLSRRFEVREIRQADLTAERAADVDVIVLANPAPVSAADADMLLKRVSDGVGLVVSAGPGWTPERQADALGTLTPAPLRDRVLLRADDPTRVPYEEIDLKSLSGPFARFGKVGEADLGLVRTRGYWLTETALAGETRVRARLGNQAPLVTDRPLGKGRLVLLATTLDRDWSDLCLRPAFLPFLDRLLTFAAGRTSTELLPYALIGEKVSSPFDEAVTLASPDGSETRWEPGTQTEVKSLGVYRAKDQTRWVAGFVARLDPKESDLGRIDASEVVAAGGGAGSGRAGFTVGAAASSGATGRQDISGTVAMGLLAALAVEALLSARRRRSVAADSLGEGVKP